MENCGYLFKSLHPGHSFQGVQYRKVVVVNFFRIFEIIIVCFNVDICDVVHDMEAINSLS